MRIFRRIKPGDMASNDDMLNMAADLRTLAVQFRQLTPWGYESVAMETAADYLEIWVGAQLVKERNRPAPRVPANPDPPRPEHPR